MEDNENKKNLNEEAEIKETENLHEETGKALTREEEIETEWANALHLDYDPEEARRKAEEANTPPPPPAPAVSPAMPIPPAYSNPPAGATPPPAPMTQEPMPQTYLVWSVLATVLCCLIPGVVAIVYSTMVSSKYYAKDYAGARRASEMAQYWIIASVVLGVITAAIYFPLSIIGAV